MKWVVMLLAALLMVACGKQEATYEPEFSSQADSGVHKEYVVGIHPLHNPKRLVEVYGPIVDHLNASIPQAHFRLEASRNFEEFDKKLFSGYFDFAMPNPYQTVHSLTHGYRVFGKMGDDELFRGIILVRRDSGIHKVSDLKGKKVAYPALSALAATMMPQYYLHTHGLDVNRDIENLYVGSQESSIMNVLRGHAAAGATWLVPWLTFQQDHPEMAAQLEVKWQTETLPNNGWVVRKDVPSELANAVGRALVGLSATAEGRAMVARLGITHFEPATDEMYAQVRRYLEKFSATVRHIEY
ncbi:MAG: phosphate/phosphite/phosphonate ABC transporter substrate-binding protein [Gammaproteobacteria bacterium]|nr:phosphate/phosphite/phosphonate ABC transporter substrate-binding protein [Gammaproteobacteria bacterium]MBU1624975.1 phosphate/phosphite/phosphonate ABC transporter substrate-binding protein [Gammaproteobacteria bacterium]MBU1981235.1 phosphate/phosphite/phosphonate ABC transporter substrate-binding protein [Gammaproteobacteria bacterium]